MTEQRDSSTVSSYWDTTGEWRLTYFDDLKKTPDEKLNTVLKAEKENAIQEETIFGELLKEAASVLELGCGVGRSMLGEIAKNPDKRFVGIDLAPAQIDIFKREIESRKLANARAYAGDVADLGWLDEKFDLIMMCNHTFGNFLGDTRKKSLEWMRRLLNSGGKIMMSGYDNMDLAGQCYKEWRVEVKQLDRETGLCRLKDYNSFWQKRAETDMEFSEAGFRLLRTVPTALGFIKIFQLNEQQGQQV